MQNGGQRNRQGGDVGQCVEVCRAGAVAHPQPFLSRRLKAGIVTLALCTQGVCSLETEAAAVNGKPVIRGGDPDLTQPLFFSPLFQFCGCRDTRLFWTGGRGSRISAEFPPLPSVVLPSLCMARPASQTGLPAGSVLEAFVPRGSRGIKASPS